MVILFDLVYGEHRQRRKITQQLVRVWEGGNATPSFSKEGKMKQIFPLSLSPHVGEYWETKYILLFFFYLFICVKNSEALELNCRDNYRKQEIMEVFTQVS